MPDANPEATAAALVGASMGAAGQRCMAISAAVFVGGMGKYKDALISKAKALKVTAGHEPGCDVGPVISPEAKKRVEDLIHSATQQVHCLCPCMASFVRGCDSWGTHSVAYITAVLGSVACSHADNCAPSCAVLSLKRSRHQGSNSIVTSCEGTYLLELPRSCLVGYCVCCLHVTIFKPEADTCHELIWRQPAEAAACCHDSLLGSTCERRSGGHLLVRTNPGLWGIAPETLTSRQLLGWHSQMCL